MKKKYIPYLISLAMLLSVAFALSTSIAACTANQRSQTRSEANRAAAPDHSAPNPTPINPKKEFTIMVYMNGSDLESIYGAATDDLAEMSSSGFDERNINLIIYTGGANKWHTRAIPNHTNAVFSVRRSFFNIRTRLEKIKDMGTGSMGDPQTLYDFMKNTA
jgi:hypothetical protein